tara:strand:- start:350 stop:796 length:447 start_codon:yes stop_codon:yes gene_type:complete
MKYSQKVIIKKNDFKKGILAFNNINFVKFLTLLQPVKIISWDGIENNKIAHFKLWFLYWHDFKVKHKNYKISKNRLSFTDQGIELPLGIKSWNHKHTLEKDGNNFFIVDTLDITHENIFLGYILLPILIIPILIRKILYKIYFYKIKK